MNELTKSIIKAVAAVPQGTVATYGEIATLAGNPRASRRVAAVLRQYSRSEGLPWHRILGSGGKIRLSAGGGMEEQAALLISEGVEVVISRNGSSALVNLQQFGYCSRRLDYY